MPADAVRVLIVDDNRVDAAAIKAALETTWHVLSYEEPIFEVAESKDAALRSIAGARPDLLVTDLFMPSKDIKKDLDARCAEMEWPHGLRLINELSSDCTCPVLVTTFFWNYPGFSRYTDTFYNSSRIDCAIPKDIFYLVASLSKQRTNLSDIEDFVPGRILAQIVYELTNKRRPSTTDMDASLRRLHLRSLFEEGSAWLRTFPHHVADVRKEIKLSPSHADTRRDESDDREDWDDFLDSARHMAACPWLPSYVFVTEADVHGEGSYSRLMEVLGEDSWKVKMEMLSPMALPVSEGTRKTQLNFGGQTYTVSARGRKPSPVGLTSPLLNPRNRRDAAAEREWLELLRKAGEEKPLLDPKTRRHVDDHRAWAELLLTLGFFTYWCHLPKVRRVSVLKASEIAEIIKTKSGRSYRGVDDNKKAAKQIADDVDDLQNMILATMRKDKKNDWGRFLQDLFGWNTPIGSKTPNDTIYWLNGSIRFRDPGDEE